MVWVSYNFKNKREGRALESSLWVWENCAVKWADHFIASNVTAAKYSTKAVKVYNLIYLFSKVF